MPLRGVSLFLRQIARDSRTVLAVVDERRHPVYTGLAGQRHDDEHYVVLRMYCQEGNIQWSGQVNIR